MAEPFGNQSQSEVDQAFFSMMSEVEISTTRPLEDVSLEDLLDMQSETEKELIKRNEFNGATTQQGKVLRMKLYDIYEEVRIRRRNATE